MSLIPYQKHYNSEFDLCKAVLEQLERNLHAENWKLCDNYGNVLVYRLPGPVWDEEKREFFTLTLRFTLKMVNNGYKRGNFASIAAQTQLNGRNVLQIPKGSEWIKVGKHWELENALRSL